MTLWFTHGPHGILQAGILEWVAFPFCRGSSQPRDQTQVSPTADGFFTIWATREAQEYWSGQSIPSPADLPNPRMKPGSLHCRQILYQWAIREAQCNSVLSIVEKNVLIERWSVLLDLNSNGKCLSKFWISPKQKEKNLIKLAWRLVYLICLMPLCNRYW